MFDLYFRLCTLSQEIPGTKLFTLKGSSSTSPFPTECHSDGYWDTMRVPTHLSVVEDSFNRHQTTTLVKREK